MAVLGIEAVFQSDVQTVWETVTSPGHDSRRSNLSRVETACETRFAECAKSGFPTAVTVTLRKPCHSDLKKSFAKVKL